MTAKKATAKIEKSSELSPAEQMRNVVNETSGTSLTISPNEQGWGGYLLQHKKKFQAPSLDQLSQLMIEEILSKRIAVQVKDGSKKKSKPFKI